jgi:hypothetical protein
MFLFLAFSASLELVSRQGWATPTVTRKAAGGTICNFKAIQKGRTAEDDDDDLSIVLC